MTNNLFGETPETNYYRNVVGGFRRGELNVIVAGSVEDKKRESNNYASGGQMSTCMYFQPVYDKHGNNINPDRNTTSGEMFCSVCKRKWRYVKRLGEYSYEEVAQDLTSCTGKESK